MSELKAFEYEAIITLVESEIPVATLRQILDGAVVSPCDDTGAGYFLTLRHPAIPTARSVCSCPLLIGRSGDVCCGFVVFIEDRELTLECYSLADAGIDQTFRNQAVELHPDVAESH